jgi:hypothetical protein
MTEQEFSNPKLYVCPDCKNQFVQPFTCITCGAQRLYDETVRQQGRQIEAQADEIERLTAELDTHLMVHLGVVRENVRLRKALEKA